MTAIGFVTVLIGFVIGIVGEANFSRTTAGLAGWLIVVGGLLLMAGASIKLWEIMP